MAKRRNQVLIVEDDATQGKALNEAFKRAGYTTVWCTTAHQAMSYANRLEFHLMVVDCLLPKMNGVDLVEEITGQMQHKPKVILLSGIFKDRNFIKDAMDRTQAETFFIKPVNLEEMMEHAKEVLNVSEPEAPPTLALYSSATLDQARVLDLIEKESALHAFHLPKLFQRLMEAGLNGELSIISANGELSSVSFYDGRVSFVRTPDKESYFGSLAVSHGFVAPEDVLEALKDPSSKMLGQKLIESMSLSPHAVNVILNEQLALRLSQTIRDEMVALQWVNRKLPKPTFTLQENRFEQLVEDWMDSKITGDWIKSTFMLWGPFEIEGDYHPRIRGSHTVEAVFADAHFNEQKDLPLMFRSLLKCDAFMGGRGEITQDFSFLESRLDKLGFDFGRLNYFQVLGLSEKAHQREVSRAFEGLKESFDPATLPARCPPELVEKCKKVYEQIEKAREVLTNDVEKLRYIQFLQNKRSQEILDAEPLFRSAIIEVVNGHHVEAAKKLDSLIQRKLDFKDLKAYRIWAGLKSNRNYSDIRLDQIPPEERHSAAYMMAKGVHHRSKSRYKKALECFRTAHVLDPRLTIAKHELQALMLELEKNRNMNRDVIREVTSVVENLFGNKKRGA